MTDVCVERSFLAFKQKKKSPLRISILIKDQGKPTYTGTTDRLFFPDVVWYSAKFHLKQTFDPSSE